MKNKKKLDLKLNIENVEYLDENYNYLYKKLVYNPLLRALTLSILLIISIIFNQRIKKLGEITSSAIFNNPNIISSKSYFLVLGLTIGICLIISLVSIIIKSNVENINTHFLRKSYMFYNIYDMGIFIISSILILLFMIMVVITPCNISGDSMNNTYHDKDKVLIWSLFYQVDNNDVIVFDSKEYMGNSDQASRFYIKRAIAIEGDTIKYDVVKSKLYVNGEFIEQITYHEYMNMLESISLNYCDEFNVPNNKILVLGDNRINSIDSRVFGFIDEESVIGRVLIRIYPISDFGYPDSNLRR